LSGAIAAAFPDRNKQLLERMAYVTALCKVLGTPLTTSWNDTEGRTQKEVVAMALKVEKLLKG